MTTYTTISDAQLENGDVFDQTLARALRDNVKAVAEGDSSVTNADRIQPKAFQDSVAGNYTVFDHTASITTGGSYAKSFSVYVPRAGVLRVVTSLSLDETTTSPKTAYIKIYKNGVALGSELSVTSNPNQGGASGSLQEDLTFAAGDTLEAWTYGDPGTSNLKIKVSNPVDYASSEV